MRTVFAALFLLMLPCHSFLPSSSSSFSSPSFAALRSLPSLRSSPSFSSSEPTHGHDTSRRIVRGAATAIGLSLIAVQRLLAEESAPSLPEVAPPAVTKPAPPPPPADFPSFRLPYNHENLPLSEFLGKATIVFNMKLDDPQTISQFPSLLEVFNKYSAAGLHVLAFPTEQGYFEPDDDETIRAKVKEEDTNALYAVQYIMGLYHYVSSARSTMALEISPRRLSSIR